MMIRTNFTDGSRGYSFSVGRLRFGVDQWSFYLWFGMAHFSFGYGPIMRQVESYGG